MVTGQSLARIMDLLDCIQWGLFNFALQKLHRTPSGKCYMSAIKNCLVTIFVVQTIISPNYFKLRRVTNVFLQKYLYQQFSSKSTKSVLHLKGTLQRNIINYNAYMYYVRCVCSDTLSFISYL